MIDIKDYRNPPRLAEWILKKVYFNREYNLRLGDFGEIYNEIIQERGILAGWFWYWNQIFKSIFSRIVNSFLWSVLMFKNYMKIAFRNVLRNKTYSFISIISLTVGMAVFLLITLFNQYELSFDRYHENADRIYRIGYDLKGLYIQADTPSILAPTCVEEIPEVLASVRMRRRNNVLTINICKINRL